VIIFNFGVFMKEKNFDLCLGDAKLVSKCANRSVSMRLVSEDLFMDVVMDLSLVNNHDIGLDFRKLYTSNSDDFRHDVLGIKWCFDRDELKLRDCFLPRCSVSD
jgi:hypothetical protein